MGTKSRSAPILESLEEKVLLSHLAPHLTRNAVRKAAAIQAPVSVKSVPLNGTTTGSYSINVGMPGGGATYSIAGQGPFDGLGNAQISGTIRSGIGRNQGKLTGSVTLTIGTNSIRLSLVGNHVSKMLSPTTLAATGSSTSPATLRYTIVSGTGAYRGLKGSGLVTLSLTPNLPPITPPVTPGAGGAGSSNAGGSGTLPGSGALPTGTTPGSGVIPVGTSTGGSGTSPVDTSPPAVGSGPTILPGTGGGPSNTPPAGGLPGPSPPVSVGPGGGTGTGAPTGSTPGSGSAIGALSLVNRTASAPVGVATFLRGQFVLTFNAGATFPPPL